MHDPQLIIDRALSFTSADHTEALVMTTDSGLTRFAQNTIHQNVSSKDTVLRVRAIIDNRTGVASGNDLSAEGIEAICKRALEAAKMVPPDPRFPGMAGPQQYPSVPEANDANPPTPASRAKAVAEACRQAEAAGIIAAGALENGTRRVTVGNSSGLRADHSGTWAEYVIVAMTDDSSGYGQSVGTTMSDLDVEAATRRALDKAITGRHPRPLQADTYAVVLEPDATSDLLDSFAYTSFGALPVQEGRSFLSGKEGTKVLAGNITIDDNPQRPEALPVPFDMEGVASRPVAIITDGMATGVVHDSYTASAGGVTSTGHAPIPVPNSFGPFATHLALKPGTASTAELIANMDEGLIVTRFHYTRVVHQPTVTVTGMTRDGTFYVRGGEIAYPVRNLRYTQSYVQALQEGVQLSRETRVAGDFGRAVCPAVYIPEFRFTGVTDF